MREISIALVYAAFFLALFAQFPLNGALPGNCDTWLVISLSNSYLLRLEALFNGIGHSTAMFPALSVHAYGESAPGCASIFLIFRLLGFGDISAYYLYISTVFALTAYGVYRLAWLFVGHRAAAAFSGFAFACSSFTLANIDDSIVVFFFIPAMTVLYFKRYIRGGKPMDAFLSAVLGGVQVCFSIYLYIYQSLILVIVAVFNARDLWRLPTRRVFPACALLYVALAAPYVGFYLFSHYRMGVENPFDLWGVLYGNALGFMDLVRALPGNVLYPAIEDSREHLVFWATFRKHAFTGILVLLLAGIGLARADGKRRLELVTLFMVGLFLALGPVVQIEEAVAFSPLKWVYEIVPFLTYLRVPLRAYFLSYLAVVILAGYGLAYAMERLGAVRARGAVALAVAAAFVYLFENVPFPMQHFEAERYDRASPGYLDFFEGKRGHVVLDLPAETGIDFDKSGDDLFFYNREVIYMNWQTQHEQSAIGGVNGYYPRTRILIQRYIDVIPHVLGMYGLARLGVDHMIHHEKMVLPYDEDPLPLLERTDFVEKVFDDDNVTIFEMNRAKIEEAYELLYGEESLGETTEVRDESGGDFEKWLEAWLKG